MSNRFEGRGNLGTDPELRYTPGGKAVCALRVYFDRSKPKDDGGFEDKGGFWLDVSLWEERGEAAAKLLTKGARVHVTGELLEESWKDKSTGEDRSKLVCKAKYVDLMTTRIEAVTWREGNSKKQEEFGNE